jgi:hypothetical protein
VLGIEKFDTETGVCVLFHSSKSWLKQFIQFTFNIHIKKRSNLIISQAPSLIISNTAVILSPLSVADMRITFVPDDANGSIRNALFVPTPKVIREDWPNLWSSSQSSCGYKSRGPEFDSRRY